MLSDTSYRYRNKNDIFFLPTHIIQWFAYFAIRFTIRYTQKKMSLRNMYKN